MNKVRRVVLVGHCGADQFMLSRAVRRAVGDEVLIESVNDSDELTACASPDALLLVNRTLDGRFGVDDGVQLIIQLSSQRDPPAAILVSNYAGAQQQAVAAGAQRGFGKSQLGDPATVELIRQAVQGSSP